MARLPLPGSDDGIWGNVLNDFLSQTLDTDGTLKTSSISNAGGEVTSRKGQPNGYAPLDSSGVVPSANLPAGSGGSPSGSAGGDLSGTYPNPSVAKINGVAVSGTPSSGQVVTATGATAASWQTPASGVTLDATATDIQPLGVRAAGSVGKAADAGHVHAMPTLNQVGAPTADLPLASHKITGLANGTVSTDAAAFGQIPTTLPPNGAAGGDLTGTYPNPTLSSTANVQTIIRANRLDQMATPTAAVTMGSQKITGLANGTVSTDAAAFGQIPASLPPNGAAGGDLSGTYPNPGVAKLAGVAVSGTPSNGKVLTATGASTATWQTAGGGSSIYVAPSADTSGAADVTSLQAALDAARTAGVGLVIGQPGSVYYINTALVIGAGVTLDMTGCTVNLAGSGVAMVRNYASLNPAASASDAATTAASNVITTALGASAVVGQSVVVAGAGGGSGGLAPLCGLVAAQTSTTITITNLDGTTLGAGATVSGASVQLFTRDTNLALRGGYWNAGAAGGGTVVDHKILFCHLDHYAIDIQGFTSTGVGYSVCVSDGRDGYGNLLNLNTNQIGGDGFHVQGPHYGLVVDRITGITGDDGLSLTASDYLGKGYTSGNIIGVHVNTVDVVSAERTMIVIAGAGNLVDDVKVFGGLRGKAAYVHIGDDTNQAQTTGGTYGNIDLGRVAVETNSVAVGLYSPAASRIRVELDYPSATAPQIGVKTYDGGGAQTIQCLEITGFFASGSSRPLWHNSSQVALDHVVLRGLNHNNTDNGSSAMVWVDSTAAINTLDIIDCQSMNTGGGGYLVLINTAGASIAQLNLIGGEMVKGYTVIGDNSTANMIATFSGGFMASGTSVVQMGGTTSGTKTYVLAGCLFTSTMNPAFFVQGASAFFRGDLMTATGSFALMGRNASETVNIKGTQLPIDLSLLSRSGVGDMAYNTNGSLACGTGPCISSGSGSAGSWKNLFTGTTY